MALPEKDIFTAEELGITSPIKVPKIKVTPEQDIFTSEELGIGAINPSSEQDIYTAEQLGIGSTNAPMTGTYPGWRLCSQYS